MEDRARRRLRRDDRRPVIIDDFVSARACANIALVKYWGKRPGVLNLPAAGSLSLTLAALVTETTVTFDDKLERDELELDGKPADAAARGRVTPFLDASGAARRHRHVRARDGRQLATTGSRPRRGSRRRRRASPRSRSPPPAPPASS